MIVDDDVCTSREGSQPHTEPHSSEPCRSATQVKLASLLNRDILGKKTTEAANNRLRISLRFDLLQLTKGSDRDVSRTEAVKSG